MNPLTCEVAGCGKQTATWKGMASHRWNAHHLTGQIPGFERKTKPIGAAAVRAAAAVTGKLTKAGKPRKPWGSNRKAVTSNGSGPLGQELKNIETIVKLYAELPTHAREFVDHKLEKL
jgi:hypothetical protein